MTVQSSRRTDVAFTNDAWTIQVESMLSVTQHSGDFGSFVHASAAPVVVIAVDASGATQRFDVAELTVTDPESPTE